MFTPDIRDMQAFYQSPGGKLALEAMLRLLQAWWDLSQEPSSAIHIGGLGYTLPQLERLCLNNPHSIAFMPEALGGTHWPHAPAPNRSCMVQEATLPLGDNSLDRLLLVHVLEYTRAPDQVLQECYRVLAPGGVLSVVVPNRRGLWAWMEGSPLHYGEPYSAGQLRRLLHSHLFTVTHAGTCAFTTPNPSRLLASLGLKWEKLWCTLTPGLGGVLCMQAEKQVYATLKEAKKSHKSGYFSFPQPASCGRNWG